MVSVPCSKMAGTITQEMHAVLASDAEDEAVTSVREQYFAFILFCEQVICLNYF